MRRKWRKLHLKSFITLAPGLAASDWPENLQENLESKFSNFFRRQFAAKIS